MAYVTRNGVEIYYEVTGSGPHVLLHTGGGGDGRMWQLAGYTEALAGEFTCIVIDHRGHGRSGKPTGVENHLVKEYADDVVAVLDAAGVERAAYWGYSAGNPVGFAMAAHHPKRVSGLVLLGGEPDVDYSDPDFQADQQRWARVAREDGVGHFVEGMRARDRIDFPEWFMEQMESTDREMFALQVEGAMHWNGPWSLAGQIECPVLLIAGDLEDPDQDNAKLAGRIPRAESVRIPGLGHVGAFVRSDLTLAEVQPFLRRVSV
jgi:pimeloyl-ACP methyl ester carboxylesterase